MLVVGPAMQPTQERMVPVHIRTRSPFRPVEIILLARQGTADLTGRFGIGFPDPPDLAGHIGRIGHMKEDAEIRDGTDRQRELWRQIQKYHGKRRGERRRDTSKENERCDQPASHGVEYLSDLVNNLSRGGRQAIGAAGDTPSRDRVLPRPGRQRERRRRTAGIMRIDLDIA